MSKASDLLSIMEEIQPTEPDQYYIIFGNHNGDLEKNHVTLIYMGALKDEQVQEAMNICEEHFKEFNFKPFSVKFIKEAMFGKDKDVRVLLPNEEDKAKFIPELREKLNHLNASQFKDFNPHLTNESDKEKEFHMNRVIFSKTGYIPLKEWTDADLEANQNQFVSAEK